MAPAASTEPGEFDPEGKDARQLNNYVSQRMNSYEDVYDDLLYAAYKQHFEKWTIDDFKKSDMIQLGKLINLLRCNGVFVNTTRAHLVAENLMNVLAETDPHVWTEEEVIAHVKRGKELRSENLNDQFAAIITMHQRPPKTSEEKAQQRIPRTPLMPETPSPFPTFGPKTRARSAANSGLGTPTTVPVTSHPNTGQADSNQHMEEQAHKDSLADLISTPQALLNLGKMYTDELKYGAEKNDSFTWKLQIFYDLCQRAFIPPTQEAYHPAFPTMLKGQALQYYYATRQTWLLHGHDPITGLGDHFEGEEYHRAIQQEWNNVIFQSVIDKNLYKTLSECLEIMVSTLQQLYHGLDRDLQTPAYHRIKLVEATHTHPAFQSATT
ncbi:conserved hypothetical protein [Talaromyces stipitatus ATCC 10500]|uniref:Uncharacterized protein n=1 Tax=Talaromyces stipitatus (strain ATCC 10500 / CBS 375.48 / QM 6759 / NRRL 1006) TaxID=441959 RepID=B8LZ29_TALSN|nr:uncharacterized protein TSTA_083060 [Talaromyces stipitatus ATCC 10500]EED21073.1 conserved hypothetical protein [Talaromyces stipitatus ATCC 10500]